MIAIDSSSLIAYLSGDGGADVEAADVALKSRQAVLPPVVRCELLSDPGLPAPVLDAIRQLPLLPLHEGFWDRAGLLRARLIAEGRNARLADALIAQSCLDHDTPLISRDGDFRQIVRVSNLKLLP
ncbi:MAG: PIN domain nuclease [Acidobacteria bacterium]|nr:PIN domain nuclease [Acidobacteriota bacterium]